MADRNIWDLKTPANHTDLTKQGLVVELWIYVFEHSAKDKKKVKADVEEASKIWCQSNINIQVVRLDRFSSWSSPGPLLEGQIDLNSTSLAEQIISCPPPDPVRDQFLSISLPGAPDITKSVAVFYIPGRRLQSGATGCHTFYLPVIDLKPQHFILLTDDADGRVLAHELGHALFTRSISASTWINDDPDSKMNPSNPIHNTDAGNLMFPKVPNNPVISPVQSSQAKNSVLTHNQKLVFGFKENKNLKLGVKIKILHVENSSDEAFSDDALESTWSFSANIVTLSGGKVGPPPKGWTRDPLEWGDHELNLDFSPLEVSSDTDKLVIEVTGEDWDFWSPNDALPSIKKEWSKGPEMWGSDSPPDPAIPGGQTGDHLEHPHFNDEIDYWLTYNIRVVDQPTETVFRELC